MTVPGLQIDSLGRVKINSQGMVLLANEGDPCCCGGGGTGKPCDCTCGNSVECGEGGADLCCCALEWDATYTASGSCQCNIDTSVWQEATTSQFGVFSEGTTPTSPAPDSGVTANLFDGSWSIEFTATRRCVNGIVVGRTYGTYQLDYVYYLFYLDGVSGAAGYTSSTIEINFDFPHVINYMDVFDGDFQVWETAFGGGTPGDGEDVPVPMFPLLQSPSGDLCSLAYDSATSLFSGTYPWSGTAPASFIPYTYGSWSGSTTRSRSCSSRSGSTSETWVLNAIKYVGPFISPEELGVGSATREYSWSLSIDVITPCDPDPCDLL